jgi:tellurite resistance protein TerC
MTLLLWIGFIVFVLVMLALDLGVFNRKAHVITTREALRWTGLCVALALVFTAVVYAVYEHNWFSIVTAETIQKAQKLDTTPGRLAALDFFQGYVIEMSLSLDNIFVIALIFSYFSVPRIFQHRVLFWGILGALVMRGGMIWAGTRLIEEFHWIIYVFGVLLIFTAFKMLLSGEGKVEPERNPLVRIARRLYPVATHFEGEKFFIRLSGKRAITPLFICLLVIESTDVLFAVDSIPAIFAVTLDPFIVFTSNVFAILCLRSMYFALAGMLSYFHYLKYSLIALLFYVGLKMLLSDVTHIDPLLSLGIIAMLLATGIVASLMHPDKRQVTPPDEKSSSDNHPPPAGDDVGL